MTHYFFPLVFHFHFLFGVTVLKKYVDMREHVKSDLFWIDFFGHRLRAYLANNRVDLSYVVPAAEPAMLVGELDMDVSTEVRSVIECVVHDFIDSATRHLRSAADYAGDGKR